MYGRLTRLSKRRAYARSNMKETTAITTNASKVCSQSIWMRLGSTKPLVFWFTRGIAEARAHSGHGDLQRELTGRRTDL